MTKWIGDRISVEDNNEVTTIVIRPIRIWWKEILLTLWVLSFSFVGLFMIYLLFTGFAGLRYETPPTQDEIDNQYIYTVVFIGFWAYFEYKTLKSLLWYRFGKELIRIDRDTFTLKRSILSYGRANKYFFENMKKFHQRKDEKTGFNHYFENAYWAMGTDSLVFEHHGKTKSFGRRLDEKTGRLLMRLIDDRVKKRIRKNK